MDYIHLFDLFLFITPKKSNSGCELNKWRTQYRRSNRRTIEYSNHTATRGGTGRWIKVCPFESIIKLITIYFQLFSTAKMIEKHTHKHTHKHLNNLNEKNNVSNQLNNNNHNSKQANNRKRKEPNELI